MYILFTNSHSYIFSKFEPKTTCFYDQLPNLPHITTKLTWNYPRFNKLCHTTSPLHHNNIITTSLYSILLLHLFLAVVSTILPMAAPATSTARQLTSPYTPTSCREASSDPPVGTPGWCLVLSEAGVVQKWVESF